MVANVDDVSMKWIILENRDKIKTYFICENCNDRKIRLTRQLKMCLQCKNMDGIQLQKIVHL